MLDIEGKRVVVIGMGASGVAAARLCLSRGARVRVTDAKGRDKIGQAVLDLENEGVELAIGGHAEARLGESDLIVVSPGVPSFWALEEAEEQGIPAIGEVELACLALRHAAPVIAVGGTNGKSTTTMLIGALLEAEGKRVFTGGNLGEPLAAHADEVFDAIVLEVSSFQMERVSAFHPRVSVLLNITDDHLDRYPSFEAYAGAKGNAFAKQTPEDAAVIPVADEQCLAQAKRGKGRVVTFGPHGDIDVTEDAVLDRRLGVRWERKVMGLSGGHNALNVAAAIGAARELHLDAATVARVLATFRGLPHRMAKVAEVAGVTFYDDSKGTNVGASVTALLGISEPKAVLIAGGKDKGGSYEPLADALRARGRAAVLIGEAAPLIEDALEGAVPVKRASTMEEAVRIGHELAHKGDAVLLSPACASFDMYRDYKHRGDEFVLAVTRLQSERGESK
ncbi:MAG: UDP-N-acetylmuramoylalanine--D-glutamate ligase [Myxococcaceae bacterium]|nr:UDP-N-acetylmuramoylalanine--D-glutamate ligase [Myxococcaceae bacterium]